MSTVAALALVVATVSLVMYLALPTMERARVLAVEILSGSVAGMPMSLEFRRLTVYQGFLWQYLNMMFFNVFGALVMWGVAVHVEGSIRWIAYATLVFHGLAAVQWLGAAAIAILYLRSKLREQERGSSPTR